MRGQPHWPWRRWRKLVPLSRLAARMVRLYGGLYVLILVVSVVLLAPAVTTIVLRQAQADLRTATLAIERNWEMRGQEMGRAADLAALDYGFRAAVASEDRATIASALTNLGQRLDFEYVCFIGVDGTALESKNAAAVEGGLTMDRAALVRAIEGARSDSGAIAIAEHIYQAAFAPVDAPDLLGWLVVARRVGAQQLRDSAELTDPRIGLDVIRAVEPAPDGLKWPDGRLSITLTRPLDEFGPSTELRSWLVASYPIAHALAPYAAPLGAIGIICVVVSVVFLFGSRAIARVIIRPIGQMSEAAKDLGAGRDTEVAVHRDDEIGDLAKVFNSMSAEIRQREHDLRALLVEQSQLLEEAKTADRAKTEFLMTMSHELRTPLNAIIGYSEIINENAAEFQPEDVAKDAQQIGAAGRHLLKLINQILDLSRIEAKKLDVEVGEFDVRDLLREVVDVVRPSAIAGNVQVTINIEENFGAAFTDRFRVKQCLLNLVSNAVKFSSGGNVTIAPRWEIVSGRKDLVIDVSDTGLGMTPSQIDRVFLPFEQADASTSRRFGGTGLGLSIALGLARALHGDIGVSSMPGEGSTFTLRVAATWSDNDGEAGQGHRGSCARPRYAA